MRELCTVLEELRERARQLGDDRRAVDEATAESARAIARLRERLDSSAELDDLLHEARRRSKARQERQGQARELEHALGQRRASRRDQARDAETANQALEIWREQWQSAVQAFAMEGLEPESADDTLLAAGELMSALKDFDEFDGRVRGISADRDDFLRRLEFLVARCMPERLVGLRERPFAVFDILRAEAQRTRQCIASNAKSGAERARVVVRSEKLQDEIAADQAAYDGMLASGALAVHEVDAARGGAPATRRTRAANPRARRGDSRGGRVANPVPRSRSLKR